MMKKGIFILVLLFFTGSVKLNAQDMIAKTDGSEIRAKVTEIGATEIKYKLFDEQDGPAYTVQKSEIFRIKYASGRIEVFNANPGVPATNQQQQTQQQQTQQQQQQTQTQQPRPQPQPQPQPRPQQQQQPFSPQPERPVTAQPYPNGGYSGYWKSDMQVKAPHLYQNYRKGAKLVKAGWFMIGGGALLAGIGMAVADKEEISRTATEVTYQLKGPGVALYLGGGIITTAGIPVVIVGYSKRNRAKREFLNSYRAEKSPAQSPHFELRTNGLAFVF